MFDIICTSGFVHLSRVSEISYSLIPYYHPSMSKRNSLHTAGSKLGYVGSTSPQARNGGARADDDDSAFCWPQARGDLVARLTAGYTVILMALYGDGEKLTGIHKRSTIGQVCS